MSNDIVKKSEDFYFRLRKRIKRWIESGKLKEDYKNLSKKLVEYLLFLPDLVHLLIKLAGDNEVPSKYKREIVVALAYLLSPLDIIPDFIPVAGMVDDLVVSAYIIDRILNSGDPLMETKIKEYWAGDEDVLNVVRRILEEGRELIEAFNIFRRGGRRRRKGIK